MQHERISKNVIKITGSIFSETLINQPKGIISITMRKFNETNFKKPVEYSSQNHPNDGNCND